MVKRLFRKILPAGLVAISGCSNSLPIQTSPVSPTHEQMAATQSEMPFKTEANLDLSLRRAALVLLVKPKVGQLSGQSSQYLTNGQFATDISGNDGVRMRKAMQIFKDSGWKTTSTVTNNMKAALSATYNNTDATKIVQKIFSIAFSLAVWGLPSDDESTLVRLGIQQQCKEFVDRSVAAVGATPKSYSSVPVSKASALPGMLAYRYDSVMHHAAIITEVIKKNGAVTSFKVVDANYNSDFSNPPGDVPWSRQIREHTIDASSYYVVDLN